MLYSMEISQPIVQFLILWRGVEAGFERAHSPAPEARHAYSTQAHHQTATSEGVASNPSMFKFSTPPQDRSNMFCLKRSPPL